MQQFTYTIQDPLGIHARPAGMLANAAKPFADTTITISKGDKSAKMTQLMRLLSLESVLKPNTCVQNANAVN